LGVTLLLFRLALDANPCPWDGIQTSKSNLTFTVHANAVGTLVQPVNRFFDRPENFGIRLFQSEPHMDITLLARLIDPVAAFPAGFAGRGSTGGGCGDFVTLLFEDFPVLLEFSRLHFLIPFLSARAEACTETPNFTTGDIGGAIFFHPCFPEN